MESTLISCFLAAFLVACALLGWRMGRSRLTLKRDRIGDREDLQLDELYSRFYADRGFDDKPVIELWRATAATLHLDPGKLRPTDRFDRELSPVRGFPVEDELVNLEESVAAICKKRGIALGALKLETLDDFMVFMLEASNNQSVK